MPENPDVHEAFRNYRNTAVALSATLLAIVGAGVYRIRQIPLQPGDEWLRVIGFILLFLLATACLGLQFVNTQGLKYFARWTFTSAVIRSKTVRSKAVLSKPEDGKDLLVMKRAKEWNKSNWWFDRIELAMGLIGFFGGLSGLMYVAIRSSCGRRFD